MIGRLLLLVYVAVALASTAAFAEAPARKVEASPQLRMPTLKSKSKQVQGPTRLENVEPEEEEIQMAPAPPSKPANKARRNVPILRDAKLKGTKTPNGAGAPGMTDSRARTPGIGNIRSLREPMETTPNRRPAGRLSAPDLRTRDAGSPSIGRLRSKSSGRGATGSAATSLPTAGGAPSGSIDGGDLTARGRPGTLAQLWVDDRHTTTPLLPGRVAEVDWDVSGVADAEGAALYISREALSPASCGSLSLSNLTSTGLPGSGVRTKLTGRFGFDPGALALGTTVRFIVCPVRTSGGLQLAGEGSNVVSGSLQGAPDLVVSSLELRGPELRFKIRNVGSFPKKVAELKYSVAQKVGSSTRTHYGVAASASLQNLAPGEESAENRVLNLDFAIDGTEPLRICINSQRAVVETSYDNNCTEFSGETMMPDLAVGSVHLLVHEPEGGWCVGLSCELTSAANDVMTVLLANAGAAPASLFKVKAQVWAGLTLVYEKEIPADLLEPGESQSYEFVVFKRSEGDPGFVEKLRELDVVGCCTAKAIVDSTARIPEVNETNNSKSVDADFQYEDNPAIYK